ncbi:histidine phosphotransferase family protein [Rhodovulum euryhalinum]|uniref:Histidine phosphotransferase ChpT n=1 Tax=Rhodovulum euryhalinum TaxID=35805 RepID=A0A4R2KNZ9_9RHOB|nr:histidine phosphotransferase family protein [Rhodovulum euryhalinum]TCO72549.1 histidine phosphotransferase ChpT [Rhodovulum euryhalinum]
MTDLTALVGSRICHDLISPIGAIGNGMELLEMLPDVAGRDELGLIADSVARANGRIRLFRLAFGAAGEGVEVAGAELADILNDYYGGSRIEIAAEPPAALPRSLAKVVLLAVLCAETSLLRGGRIAITGLGGEIALTAEGDRLNLDPRLWLPIAEGRAPEGEISAAEVQFALLPAAARAAGRHLALSRGDTRFDLVL